ncbi:MAG: hypothetical protein ABI763_10100 [Bacteroidota bacterium]
MLHRNKLSAIQLELLKIYSFSPSEKQLEEIRTMLGKYFAKNFSNKVSTAAAKKGFTQKDIDKWLRDEKK